MHNIPPRHKHLRCLVFCSKTDNSNVHTYNIQSIKKHFNQNARDLGLVHLSKKYGNKIMK